MKKFKRDLSCFTDLPSMLRDIYTWLYFESSPIVRSQIPPKNLVKKYKIVLKNNSLDGQLTHQVNLRNIDNELIDYFINGGEIVEMWFFCYLHTSIIYKQMNYLQICMEHVCNVLWLIILPINFSCLSFSLHLTFIFFESTVCQIIVSLNCFDLSCRE